MIIKRLMAVFICLQIALFPNLVFASSIADSGWNITSSIVNGATTTFNAAKTKIINGASVAVTGVAKITPTGPQVGKFILKTGLTLAVTIALDELVNGVDYVLDPANNSITYKPKSASTTCSANGSDCPSSAYLYNIVGGPDDGSIFSSGDAACSFFNSKMGSGWWGSTTYQPNRGCVGISSGTVISPVGAYVNPAYDPSKDEKRTIGVDVVGGQIVTDAASKDEARAYTNSVANTITAPNEQDQIVPAVEAIGQFDNTSSYPSETTADTKTDTKTNADGTTTTTGTTDLPAACSWMPSVCEAAQVIITKPQVWADAVSTAWADFWTEPDLQKKDDTVDVENKPVDSPSKYDTDYVNFGGSCPTFSTNTITVGSISIPLSFDLTPFCDWAKLLRPAVLGVAYLSALAIISTAIKDA